MTYSWYHWYPYEVSCSKISVWRKIQLHMLGTGGPRSSKQRNRLKSTQTGLVKMSEWTWSMIINDITEFVVNLFDDRSWHCSNSTSLECVAFPFTFLTVIVKWYNMYHILAWQHVIGLKMIEVKTPSSPFHSHFAMNVFLRSAKYCYVLHCYTIMLNNMLL